MGRRWTDEEIEILKEKYPEQGTKIEELDRSRSAIKSKVRSMNISYGKKNYPSTYDEWTNKEIEILKEKYPRQGTDIEELDRSANSIQNKANELGIKYGEKKEVKCDYCGNTIKKRSSNLRKTNHNFCDMECYGNWRKGKVPSHRSRVERKCPICGTKFEVPKHRLERGEGKYCSKECQHKSMMKGEGRVKIKCKQCGDKFEVPPSKAEGQHERKFCSKECYYEWRSENWVGENCTFYKGGYEPYYGPNWYKQRRKVLKRDNYTCQRCGKTEEEMNREPSVHHKTPLREFNDYRKANKMDNLITLCMDCHRKIEHKESEIMEVVG